MLFENNLKILGYGLFLAVPLYVMAYHFRRKGLWIACGVITLLMVIALIIEGWVVTPKEEVQQVVRELAQIVERNDVDELMNYLSKSNPNVVKKAQYEMPRYEFSTCNLMVFHEIRIDENNPRKAVADFMVRFNVSMKGYSGGGFRDVLLKFEKESDDRWRITDYSHYDPTNRPGRQNFLY